MVGRHEQNHLGNIFSLRVLPDIWLLREKSWQTCVIPYEKKIWAEREEFVENSSVLETSPWSVITRHSLMKLNKRNKKHKKLSFYWVLNECQELF
jgi:hypothetical protein